MGDLLEKHRRCEGVGKNGFRIIDPLSDYTHPVLAYFLGIKQRKLKNEIASLLLAAISITGIIPKNHFCF